MPHNTKIDVTGTGAPETSTAETSAVETRAVETKASTEIPCPHCAKKVAWTEASLFRPFCSERCRLIDLGAWASESHRIAGEDLAPEDKDTY